MGRRARDYFYGGSMFGRDIFTLIECLFRDFLQCLIAPRILQCRLCVFRLIRCRVSSLLSVASSQGSQKDFCSLCEQCGDGFTNFCDQEECNGSNDYCTFLPGLVGGTC